MTLPTELRAFGPAAFEAGRVNFYPRESEMAKLHEIIYWPVYEDKPKERERITVNPAIWGRVKVDYPEAGERVWIFTAGKLNDITDMLVGPCPKFALVE